MKLTHLPWKKRLLIVAVILIAVGGWYYWKSTTATQGDLASKAVVVERRNLVSTVAATGTINASDKVDIGSKISGRILKVYIEENSYVKEGDILMELDTEQISSQVAQTQATLDNSVAFYERQKKLFSQGAIAAQTLDDAEKTYLVAKANHQSTLSQLNDTIHSSSNFGLCYWQAVNGRFHCISRYGKCYGFGNSCQFRSNGN